ncbi:MAG TPA: hypothetical protein VFE75_05505 [Rhodanobacter sp.]|jgi:hypothetical protein|nr:hypothetical protein [Rhodanobacter sp.]
MSPLERIAGILAESGHSPTEVAFFVERLQQSIALRTLPDLLKHKLTDVERQRACGRVLEGRSAAEAIGQRRH